MLGRVRESFLQEENLGSIHIDGASPLCNKTDEILNHLLITSDLLLMFGLLLASFVLPPIKSNFTITNWIEYIWIQKNWYDKIFDSPLKVLYHFMGYLDS